MITKDDFDTVITLYSWAQPVDWLVEEVRYGFYDSEISHIDFAAVERAADFAYQAWKSGKRVLIRCQAGINRSSLVMAHVLMKDKYKAREAIDLMREKRSKAVLLNRHFVDYLVMSEEVPLER
jgi:protein-tyrosine phosphatase